MGVVEPPVQQRSGHNIVAEQFPKITEILVAGQDINGNEKESQGLTNI